MRMSSRLRLRQDDNETRSFIIICARRYSRVGDMPTDRDAGESAGDEMLMLG